MTGEKSVAACTFCGHRLPGNPPNNPIRVNIAVPCLVTVTFEEDGRKTIMTLRHVGIPPETISDCAAGWSESFDKLEGIL